jgi:murein DD-endopeptidase MepM/ murein hydrolase activator NlpD
MLALALLGSGLILTCVLFAVFYSTWPIGTLAALLEATSTPTPIPTATQTPTSTPTRRPTATHTHTATPVMTQPQSHQLLGRPFDDQNNNKPSRFYPYGSTAGGKYRVHRGADFPNPSGVPVLAAAKGRVIVAGTDHRIVLGERVNFYGDLVIVQLEQTHLGQKIYVLYGHLSNVHVRFLQEVAEGDLIGEVGMTGVAIGPHLHLELRVGQNSYEHTRNPELWVRPLSEMGTVAGLLADVHGQPIPEHALTFYRVDDEERRWQDVTTYPLNDVNADSEWPENFVLGDIPAGRYLVKTYVNGHLHTEEVAVRPGEVTYVTIVIA